LFAKHPLPQLKYRDYREQIRKIEKWENREMETFKLNPLAKKQPHANKTKFSVFLQFNHSTIYGYTKPIDLSGSFHIFSR
jgi:hypothetical protein